MLAREDAFDVGEAGVALAALAANDAATAALLKKLHPEGEDLNAPRLAEVWRHNGFESGLYFRRVKTGRGGAAAARRGYSVEPSVDDAAARARAFGLNPGARLGTRGGASSTTRPTRPARSSSSTARTGPSPRSGRGAE